MTLASRSIRVHRFPVQVNDHQTNHLLGALRREAEFERPCFVLDCSKVHTIDTRGMFLLLTCLEEAMKCNGDVRLAGIQPQVMKQLRRVGINSLFEIFPTTETATRSFQKRINPVDTLTFSEEFIESDVRTVA